MEVKKEEIIPYLQKVLWVWEKYTNELHIETKYDEKLEAECFYIKYKEYDIVSTLKRDTVFFRLEDLNRIKDELVSAIWLETINNNK